MDGAGEEVGLISNYEVSGIDQNGDHIELITEEAHDGEYDTDDTEEDHEFTVIVEDTDQVG